MRLKSKDVFLFWILIKRIKNCVKWNFGFFIGREIINEISLIKKKIEWKKEILI